MSSSSSLSVAEAAPASWATVIEEERQRRLQVIKEQYPLLNIFRECWRSGSINIYDQSIENSLFLVGQSQRTDSPFFGLNLSGKGVNKTHLKVLVDTFTTDVKLCTLDLSNNALGDSGLSPLLQALKTNTSLTKLDLERNDISRKGIRAFIDIIRPHNFTLSFLNLGTMKKGTLSSLSRKVSKSVDELLRQLDGILAQNKMIFDCLYQDGKHVVLSDRRLSKIPELLIPIAPLLTKLDLSNNQITIIPEWFVDLANLTFLDLSDNLIESLPDAIGQLEKLLTLRLSNNRLVKIPEALVLLGHLENLYLENNLIQDIPTGVGSLGKLRTLELSGNPFLTAAGKRSSLERPIPSTLDSFKERVWMGTETRDSFQMKLTVLGKGNVGKTSLLRAMKLLDHDKTINFRETMKKYPNVATDGIEFDQWTVGRSGNRLVFTVLDCAGQSVYHLTHQFFLTGRSLYLVVFSLEDSNFASEIEYWLNAIQSFTGDTSPVLIIGTHIDRDGVTKEYVKSLFQYLHTTVGSRFPIIRGYFGVSSTSGEGISDLIDQMMNAVSSLPWLPTQIPVSFDVLREKLIGMEMVGRQILTRREFSKLAIVCGIPNNQISAVLQWFSEIGLILYFENIGGQLLSSTIVLSPQWLANLFKTIITLKANYVQGGFLLIKDLQHIWKPPSVPPQLHARCITLLEHFEAIYRFSTDLLLVPALLPREPSKANLTKYWPEVTECRFMELIKSGDWEGCHHARFFLFQTFPPDFFSRLLVRIFRTHIWVPLVLWSNGAVLRAADEPVDPVETPLSLNPRAPWMPNVLFMEIDTTLNIISIRTRGTYSAQNIARLSTSLENLIHDWLKIRYEIFVPCLCSIGRRLPQIAQSLLNNNQHRPAGVGPKTNQAVPVNAPTLPPQVAIGYGLCVEDILSKEVEANAPIVTEALGLLTVATGDEDTFRYFLSFFINMAERYKTKSNRRLVSFISTLPIDKSGQSIEQVVTQLKAGTTPSPSPSVPTETEEDIPGLLSFFRNAPDEPVPINLPDDLRGLLTSMSLQTAFGNSLDCSVENFNLQDHHLKAIALTLRHSSLTESRLTTLRLIDCSIHPLKEGFNALMDAIFETDTLLELDLSHNPIGDMGIHMLIEKVKSKELVSHSFWNVTLDHVSASSSALLSLIKTLAGHSPLKNPLSYLSSISLKENDLGPSFFEALRPILQTHVTIWSITLEGNPGCHSPAARDCSELLYRNFQICKAMRYIFNKSLALINEFPPGKAVWQLGSVYAQKNSQTLALDQLTPVAFINHIILILRQHLPRGDRLFRRRTYLEAFTGREAVSFLYEYIQGHASRPCFVAVLSRMMKKGWIISLSRPSVCEFSDSDHIYRFGPDDLLPHIWKKYSHIVEELKAKLPRIVQPDGTETNTFLATDAIEYLASNHDNISAAEAESLLEYLSEFSVIFNPKSPGMRFFNSDFDAYQFGSQTQAANLLQTLGDIHLFPLQQCSLAISQNLFYFRCPRWHLPIRVDSLVPDVSMDHLSIPKVDLNQAQTIRVLSAAAIGESAASIAVATLNGQTVVIKRLNDLTDDALQTQDTAFAQFRRELWMMCSMHHKYILPVLGYSLRPMAIILEYMDQGDLAAYIGNNPIPPWPERLRLLIKISKALLYLHGNCPPIIHLDFKSPNILLRKNPKGKLHPKVCDFGLSRSLELTQTLTGPELLDNCIWSAPELLVHKPATIKSDIYSFAIVMWEVCFWSQPFAEHRFMHAIHNAILEGQRPHFELSAEAAAATPSLKKFVDLMKTAWSDNPAQRPSIEEIHSRLCYLLDLQMGKTSVTAIDDILQTRSTRSITNFGAEGIVDVDVNLDNSRIIDPGTPSPASFHREPSKELVGLDIYSQIRIQREVASRKSMCSSNSTDEVPLKW